MNTSQNLIRVMFSIVTLSLLFVSIFFVFGAASGGHNAGAAIHYGPANLLGKSPDEIGQLAQRQVQLGQQVHADTPQVLLSRFVRREDLPALGLSCMPASLTIEEPPLALVILKGDFDWRLRTGNMTLHPHYLVYIYDIWAGEVTQSEISDDGSRFRIALNDPTLPNDETPSMISCPDFPGPKTLHYGDTPSTIPPGTAVGISTLVPSGTPPVATATMPILPTPPPPTAPIPVSTWPVPLPTSYR